MISKPARGEDIQAWCARLVDELQPLLNLTGDGKHIAVGRGSIRFIPRPRNYAFVAGKAWPKSTWTGDPTRWLCVYRDGVTPPAYIAQQTWETGLSAGMPADAEYFDLEADDIHVDGF